MWQYVCYYVCSNLSLYNLTVEAIQKALDNKKKIKTVSQNADVRELKRIVDLQVWRSCVWCREASGRSVQFITSWLT